MNAPPTRMTPPADGPPTVAELTDLVRAKFGPPDRLGWAVRRRNRAGYFTPDDWYEALVRRLVVPGTAWLDVGGGASVFPHNPAVARELADRSGVLVCVDPSDNVTANPYAHERAQCLVEEYRTDRRFDLATLRMVAEHIADPPAVAAALARLLKPGGRAVVYTVNRLSPIALTARHTPFLIHYPMKKLLWGGEEKDTFPVLYRMNTRRELRAVFAAAGFIERLFLHLDDLATFSQVRWLNWLEIRAWRAWRSLKLRYPENCLLGVYQTAD